ncbi:MAG: ABC transporter substrate-binding protein [Burkholderiales bacterium]|nr:ABC transporter substrate-binding protein [Burkholderiales bacterium]MDE1927523.1 ABC transporter substrate-binding protein [Burkholderiales bacterium]MDE2145441.1 ABC transporter substrate-binding protein [Burkholderiales bacterium]MDE2501715.1 ABC transporter substrate-binding protein [Burkholderiales bacterium]
MIESPDRRFRLQQAAALALAGTLFDARAQGPEIHVLCGFAPGGSVDGLARMAADVVGPLLGGRAIVENVSGASGRIAIERVKAAAPDGATLVVAPQGPMTLFPYVFKHLRFDPARDFTPLARMAVGDFALSTGPLTGAKSVAEFRAWVLAHPVQANFGSPGAGTLPHFVGLRVASALGIHLTQVPYRGSMLSMNDLAAGTLAAVVSPVTEAMALHKAGRVRILATASIRRTPFVDDVPTLKELGYDVDVPLWYGLWGPAGMPPALVEKINRGLAQAQATPALKSRLALLGLEPGPMTSAEMVVLRNREAAMWKPIVAASGFKPND